MNCEIITIGDEILIGQIVDTNSAWMAQQLNIAGIKVKQITSVSDDEQHIIDALDEAKKRADIILITGGLGPTKDDITKNTLCKYFKTKLRFDEASFAPIEKIFKARGRTVSETNRTQAMVPENCKVIQNTAGTAPGMWFEQDGKVFMSMPGVPHEMKAMMEKDVISLLKKKFITPAIIHKTILTQGIGESFLSDLFNDWENNLPKNMKLAYLPSTGMVRLRISALGKIENELREQVEKEATQLIALAKDFIYGYENDTLEELVGKLLREKNKTLSTAESCTGGFIAHKITSVPGSSDYYIGSVVAYANIIKEKFLDVDEAIIEKYGAVSEEAVRAMALSVRKKFNTDYSIATSGIAGPSGGTDEKPVGTVWVAIATPDKIISKKLQLGNHRLRVILETAQHALNMLRKELIG